MKKENPSITEVTKSIVAKLSQGASKRCPKEFDTEVIAEDVGRITRQPAPDPYIRKKITENFAGQGATLRRSGQVVLQEELFLPECSPGETRYGTNPSGLPERSNSRGGGRRHSHQYRKTYRG